MIARDVLGRAERELRLPGGGGERFSGYGVMGLPFESGHVLALRRCTVSSLGPGYTSVWHRDPAGRWTFYADVSPDVSCARYFGREVERNVLAPIDLEWTGGRDLHVRVRGALDWHVALAASPATRAFTCLARGLPEAAWRSPAVLRLAGTTARHVLRTGRLNLLGTAPNGQRFVATPRRLWLIASSRATIGGVDAGRPSPLATQASMRDFHLPQRGLFVLASARFDPPLRTADAPLLAPPRCGGRSAG